MHPNLRRGHDALWARFYHEPTHLIYDVEFLDPAQYPTPQEVEREYPSCAGWGTGMEDCCLTAGFVLDGLLTAHRVTGDAEWADKSRKIFAGLVELGMVSGVPGYIARGFAPGRHDVYPNSSADQYTSFVWGLWNYARSPLVTAEERRTATRLLVEVAQFVADFHDDIPRRDGRPSIYGDTSSLIADRACRILMFYKAAADLSGDDRWVGHYQRCVEQDGRKRLGLHYGPEPWPADRNLHSVMQNQAAFRLLYEAESDPTIQQAYATALRDEAQAVLYRISLWREIVARPLGKAMGPNWRPAFYAFLAEHPDYDPADPEDVKRWHTYRHPARDDVDPALLARAKPSLPWLRHQTEALATVMLCSQRPLQEQAGREAWPMLTDVDWTLAAQAGVWESLEPGYWRGVEAGAFPR